MKKEVYYCDICGKRVGDHKTYILKGYDDVELDLINSMNTNLSAGIRYADICPECKNAIQRFFDSRITAFMEKGDKNNG